MFRHFRGAGCLPLLFAAGLLSQSRSGAACVDQGGGVLYIRVVSETGILPDRAEFIFTQVSTNRVLRLSLTRPQGSSSYVIAGVPCGQYTLAVKTPLLDTTRRQRAVNVTDMPQSLTLEFPVDEPIDRRGAAALVSIRCRVHSSDVVRNDGWAKLIDLYGDLILESRVDRAEAFTFLGLHPGSYVLVFTEVGKSPVVKALDLHYGQNEIEISTPARPVAP